MLGQIALQTVQFLGTLLILQHNIMIMIDNDRPNLLREA